MIVNGKSIKNGKNVLPQIRRDQITAATYKVVSRKGYYDFTIMDVARETGLSTGLILYYFKNKQNLLLNLFRETQRNVRDNLLRQLEKAEDPLGKLEIFIDQSFLLFENEKDYFYLLFEFWTQLKRNKDIRRMVQKLYQAYRDELSFILKTGMERGIFRDMDVQYSALICVSLVQHTIIQHLIDDRAFDFKAYSAKIRQCIFDMVLKDPCPKK
ncbi:MAG: TetR/AcrR family transcriptional regulator [Syntrophales bacterium]|nr:TetR/AcrR family transcriptional regulator [Syntrophales bacterium]